MRRILGQPWFAYLVLGTAAVGLYYALPWNSTGETVVYDGIGVSSAAAVIWGAYRNRPTQRLPWLLFAAGLVSFAIGDSIFNVYADVLHQNPPVPSSADVFYLGGYPLLAAGLTLLIVRFQSSDRRAGLIDAAMITAAFGVAQWIFVMHDQLRVRGTLPSEIVALSYPAMDIVLLSALAVFFLSPAWKTIAYRYLVASIILLVVADEINAISGYSYATTSWLDNGWLFSYVLWGVAALHPSMTALSRRTQVSQPRLTGFRLALLAAALLVAPAILLAQHLLGQQIEVFPIVTGATILAAFVLVRLAGLVQTLARLRAEERAARSEAESARRLLVEQNDRLREADRLKDEFVALISHDLRTPLTSIMGYVELALDVEGVNEEQRAYLEVVQRNSDRLLHLVNDLLFVARLEAGELTLNLDELDLSAIVKQAVAEAQPRAAAKSVALRCEADAVSLISGDRGRMFQLLDNLISNAVKFSPDGGTVTVGLAEVGDHVRLEVADTGIGIPQVELRRLFERFFRATTARDRQIPGTGLGLYIAHAIVAAHEGSITAQSEPGEGAVFSIELPLERVSHAVVATGAR